MSDSKQLAVLKRLTEWLQGITPDNGYDFDLSEAVYRGRQVLGAETPVPAIGVLESPKPEIASFAGENNVAQYYDWILLLQGWAPDDPVNPTDPAYQLKAAVEKRLSDIIAVRPGVGTPLVPAAYLLGRLIASLEIGPGVCRPPDQLSSKAYFYIPLKVCLGFDVRNPFVVP